MKTLKSRAEPSARSRSVLLPWFAALVPGLAMGLTGCGGVEGRDVGEVSSAVWPDEVVTLDLSGVYSPPMMAGTPMPPLVWENLEEVPPKPVLELRLPAGAGATSRLAGG